VSQTLEAVSDFFRIRTFYGENKFGTTTDV
jgi:hypothetical protein